MSDSNPNLDTLTAEHHPDWISDTDLHPSMRDDLVDVRELLKQKVGEDYQLKSAIMLLNLVLDAADRDYNPDQSSDQKQSPDETQHSIQGLYHTGVAYTAYRCVDCGEQHTTPRGFNTHCESTDATDDDGGCNE